MTYVRVLLALFIIPLSLYSQTEFSMDSAFNYLHHLAVDIGPRPMGSPAEQAGLQFAAGKFKEFGCDTAYILPMPYTSDVNTHSGIAVGIKHGTTGRIIVIGGHMDSAGPEIPGADDDGSGSATIIECSRVLARRQHSSTLVFCCFGGEEQGLQGSKYFVDHFPLIDSVALMLQVDMANGLGILDLDPDKGGGLSAPRWLVRASTEEFSKLRYQNLRYPTHFFSINYAAASGAGSDHESFLDKGIPAIDFSTDVNKPIHTPRDIIENFDPRGLKRSGDLVIRLTERFDGGTPDRTLDRYWLYLIGGYPLFLPVWSLWLIFAVALIFSLFTLYSLWHHQKFIPGEPRIRWSGAKIWLCTLIIVLAGWFSSDLIGLIRGVRFPWLVSYQLYYLFACIAMLLGFTVAYRIARRLHIVRTAMGLYVRAFILLALLAICLSFWSTKLVIEPTVALLLLNVAILIPNRFIKLIPLVLSPVWPLRLIFSEWDGLLFRPIARSLSPTFEKPLLIDAFAVLIFSVLLLPFAYGAMAIIRQKSENERMIQSFATTRSIIIILTLFLGMMGYLLTTPMYDSLWYKSIFATGYYNLTTHEKNVIIQGAEFLTGTNVTGSGHDTTITGHTTTFKLDGRKQFDTSWATIDRTDTALKAGNQTAHNILLKIRTAFRPYTVTVQYSSQKNNLASFSTSWKFRSVGKNRKDITWYSFPDTLLTIPVSFTVDGGDSVREEISITFAALACPVTLRQDFAYVIPRTNYVSDYIYRKD